MNDFRKWMTSEQAFGILEYIKDAQKEKILKEFYWKKLRKTTWWILWAFWFHYIHINRYDLFLLFLWLRMCGIFVSIYIYILVLVRWIYQAVMLEKSIENYNKELFIEILENYYELSELETAWKTDNK